MKVSSFVPKVEPKYLLELTRDEAVTLLLVAHWIGGNDEHSRRGHMTALTFALNGAGVSLSDADKDEVVRFGTGIYFKDRTKGESK